MIDPAIAIAIAHACGSIDTCTGIGDAGADGGLTAPKLRSIGHVAGNGEIFIAKGMQCTLVFAEIRSNSDREIIQLPVSEIR